MVRPGEAHQVGHCQANQPAGRTQETAICRVPFHSITRLNTGGAATYNGTQVANSRSVGTGDKLFYRCAQHD